MHNINDDDEVGIAGANPTNGTGSRGRTTGYNPSPLSDTDFRYHKYMQFLKQIYLPILLLLIAIEALLIKMKLQYLEFQSVQWQIIFIPVWIGTIINTIATSYELRLSNRRRRTKTYIIEHINHLIFWFTISIVLILLCFKLNGNTTLGATVLLFPLYIALIAQSILYFFKDKRLSCGCNVPEGFPADPVYITSLFIALRVDQVIWWDWTYIFWCPWIIWMVALFDGLQYTRKLLHVLYQYFYLTEPGSSWGDTTIDGIQYLFNPFWHVILTSTRWAMAFMLIVTLYMILDAAAEMLNGNVDISIDAIIMPLVIMMIWSSLTQLLLSFYIKPRLLQREPAKCGLCKKQIRQILRIKKMKNETNGNIIVKVIDQGDIDERVVRTVRNIYGLLRSNNTPTELIKPKGKSFFLINGNHRNQDSNTNDDEIERLIPSSTDKLEYMKTNNTSNASNYDNDENDYDDEDDENSIFRGMCPICSENVPIDCVFLDCGHNIYCWKCGVDEFDRRIAPH